MNACVVNPNEDSQFWPRSGDHAVNIRPYRESDRQTLKEITVEAFAGVSIDQNIERRFGPVAGHDWRWRKAGHIDEDLDDPDACVWVAEDAGGEIIGYITTRVDRAAGIGLIPNMSVRAGLRGQGIGRKLIERALDHFQSVGLELARIETLDQNPVGQHLYPACGFVEVARQIHFALRLSDRNCGGSAP
jgi:ribosomal protein S18 acetylase RimI-like enzyme